MRMDRGTNARAKRGHGWVPLLVCALAGLLAPAVVRAQSADTATVRLAWTAPGDDGTIGAAAAYELRVATAPITLGNWDAARVIAGVPAPLVAGTRQTAIADALNRGTTYYFAIRAVDDADNWSGLSNVLRWDWLLDTAPPAAPTSVTAALQGSTDVKVQWAANSEADLGGYTVYRALTAGGPWVALTTSLIVSTQYIDSSIPAGTQIVWYQVSASDVSGNEGARSASVSVSLIELTASWHIESAYPNPSATGDPVRFPIVVPESGGGDAVLEIMNSGGQRVRRVELGSVGPGARTLVWDGLNDSGKDLAPGVYTAWLVAKGVRLHVKLVRVP